MDNLTHNKQTPYCIKIKNQQLSFALENNLKKFKKTKEIQSKAKEKSWE